MAVISEFLFAGSMSSKQPWGAKEIPDMDNLEEKLSLQTVMSSVCYKQALRHDNAK